MAAAYGLCHFFAQHQNILITTGDQWKWLVSSCSQPLPSARGMERITQNVFVFIVITRDVSSDTTFRAPELFTLHLGKHA